MIFVKQLEISVGLDTVYAVETYSDVNFRRQVTNRNAYIAAAKCPRKRAPTVALTLRDMRVERWNSQQVAQEQRKIL